MWIQKELTLRPRPRGFHLVTTELLAYLLFHLLCGEKSGILCYRQSYYEGR